MVDRGRESPGKEARDVAPGGAAGARDGTAGAATVGQTADELRVGGAGLDEGEVGGGALVEGDEFVGLGSGQAAPAAQQGVETVPLAPDGRSRRHRGPWCCRSSPLGGCVSACQPWPRAPAWQTGRYWRGGHGKDGGVSELVTGEAVALELRPARLPSRALAVVLDLAVAMTVYIIVTVGWSRDVGAGRGGAGRRLGRGFVLLLVAGRSRWRRSPWPVAGEAGVRAAGGPGRRGADPVPACAGARGHRGGRQFMDPAGTR